MKKLQLVSATTALVLSTSAGAATIAYNGFSHDESTNIVNGEGLEWMQWSATNGMSVDNALAAYAGSGWRLATSYEMTYLLNTFYTTDHFENPGNDPINQSMTESHTYAEEGTSSFEFTRIFGATVHNAVGAENSTTQIVEELWASRAFFGTNPSDPGTSLVVNVQDDYKFRNCNRSSSNECLSWGIGTGYAGARAVIDTDGYFYDGSSIERSSFTNFSTSNSVSTVGVALVRGEELSAVPVPAAVWLFGSGLIGLIGFARRKKA